jgi:hypothetical protein
MEPKFKNRYRVYLFNINTGERQAALGKHTAILSKREAQALVRLSKQRQPNGPWQYKAEPLPVYTGFI